ncbi:NAD(P)H-dependent oxidoreductase [Candidatus Nitrospira bockiana]
MVTRITLIQGHPDRRKIHLGHALAEAYIQAAEEAGHQVNTISVADLDFPLLRTKEEFESGVPPECIREAQEAIRWAGHLVIVYPLWHGMMPALLKGFFEQVFRPGFALGRAGPGKMPPKLLKGRSARIILTMGMPALIYRWYFRAHGLKSLERSILGLSGIAPIRESLIGMVEGVEMAKRRHWIEKMKDLGRRAV